MTLTAVVRSGSEAAFQSAWIAAPDGNHVPSDLFIGSQDPVEALFQLVRRVQSSLPRAGFRAFRNGGRPLLERRTAGWIEEIVFRMPAKPRMASWTPFSIDVHISCSAIAEVRSRYWRTASRPSLSVARGNLGALREPATWDLWNLAAEDPSGSLSGAIAEELRANTLPWFELFHAPRALRQRLFRNEMPRLAGLAGIEWCLLEYGAGEAARYLDEVLCRHEVSKCRLRRLLSQGERIGLEGGPEHSVEHNLAALALAYRIEP